MLKKILLSFFIFFIGFWYVFATEDFNPSLNLNPEPANHVDTSSENQPVQTTENPPKDYVTAPVDDSAEWAALRDKVATNATNANNTANNSSNNSNDLTSPGFMFNPSDLSPSSNKYERGWDNVKLLLTGDSSSGKLGIANLLLIVLPTISVLFMVYGWIIIIISAWVSEKVTKWKQIIVNNIIAIVVALLSYSIIKLVIWILWSTAF